MNAFNYPKWSNWIPGRAAILSGCPSPWGNYCHLLHILLFLRNASMFFSLESSIQYFHFKPTYSITWWPTLIILSLDFPYVKIKLRSVISLLNILVFIKEECERFRELLGNIVMGELNVFGKGKAEACGYGVNEDSPAWQHVQARHRRSKRSRISKLNYGRCCLQCSFLFLFAFRHLTFCFSICAPTHVVTKKIVCDILFPLMWLSSLSIGLCFH